MGGSASVRRLLGVGVLLSCVGCWQEIEYEQPKRVAEASPGGSSEQAADEQPAAATSATSPPIAPPVAAEVQPSAGELFGNDPPLPPVSTPGDPGAMATSPTVTTPVEASPVETSPVDSSPLGAAPVESTAPTVAATARRVVACRGHRDDASRCLDGGERLEPGGGDVCEGLGRGSVSAVFPQQRRRREVVGRRAPTLPTADDAAKFEAGADVAAGAGAAGREERDLAKNMKSLELRIATLGDEQRELAAKLAEAVDAGESKQLQQRLAKIATDLAALEQDWLQCAVASALTGDLGASFVAAIGRAHGRIGGRRRATGARVACTAVDVRTAGKRRARRCHGNPNRGPALSSAG